MAFNVSFWTFSKKERSTAQPSGQGSVYSCNANEPLDLLAPVISLKLALNTASPPTVYNYARIANFSRYYWVTGWEIRDGLWWASLRVDVLASWKSQIGSSSLYVYRSSYAFNGKIPDSAYPQMTDPTRTIYAYPKVWTVDGANYAGTASGTYTIVAGIISTAGTKYYAFSPAQWTRFYAALFSSNFYEDVLSFYGATEYPEAKVAVNPLQYISSAMIVPMDLATFPDTPQDYKITYHQTLLRVPVANVYVPRTNTGDNIACELPDGAIMKWSYSVYVDPGTIHPQAATRGEWLNYGPNTEFEFFWPPLGNIPLEASVIANANAIKATVTMDIRAGTAMLELTAEYLTYKFVLYRGECPIGVPIQLTNVLTTGTNTAGQGALNAASWLQSNLGVLGESVAQAAGYIPVVGGIWTNGIRSAVHGNVPRLSSKGSYGNLANMGGQPNLYVTHWNLAPEDNAGKGRPLCDIRQISAVPGFITAEADELSISCTDPELSEIRQAVSTGFFYE